MCYMSDVCVCLHMSDRIMSDSNHLNFNLPLTIILTKEENRNRTLPRYRDNRYTGLMLCLDICFAFCLWGYQKFNIIMSNREQKSFWCSFPPQGICTLYIFKEREKTKVWKQYLHWVYEVSSAGFCVLRSIQISTVYLSTFFSIYISDFLLTVLVIAWDWPSPPPTPPRPHLPLSSHTDTSQTWVKQQKPR